MTLDPAQALELMRSAAQAQIDLTRQVLENHLDAADRIHARTASESLVKVAEQIATNPTSPANP